jgi:hypothetical protein
MAACGSNEATAPVAQPQTATNASTTTLVTETTAIPATLSEEAKKVAKQYEIALEAARGEDWATVEKEIKQILTVTKDATQIDVANVLLGKIKADDRDEVMIHIMKLLSLSPEQASISIWYREIYRHAKNQEWKQLDIELHETVVIAPADVEPKIQQFIDQLNRGETDTLAEAIKQFSGLSDEE